MFQTFKGSSRRPRQVNLSGQNIDPFAASSWTPTASGTQKTVAVAQQERRQRQLERDRLEAIKKIQKTWRGHKCRTDLAAIQRREWDALEQSLTGETEPSWTRLPEELRLLLAFYNTRDGGDIERLSRLSDRLISYHDTSVLTATQIRPYVLRLSNILSSSMVR
jgi:ubiquitin-protein ligase E3 C